MLVSLRMRFTARGRAQPRFAAKTARALGLEGMARRLSGRAAPLAVFDLDGTLADTRGDIAAAANAAIDAKVEVETVKSMVGDGAKVLMERMLKHTQMGCFYSVDEAVQNFLKNYKTTDATRLYDGVREGLERLKGEGIELAICTNKPQRLAEECISTLGLDHLFPKASIHGFVTGLPLKPHVAHLQRACGGEKRENVCMVGDGVADIVGARLYPMPVISVTYGNSPRASLQELKPDFIVDRFSPEAIDAVLEALNQK